MNTDFKNIITKEFAWHYRIIPEMVSENSISFLIDSSKINSSISDELEVVLGKKIELLEKDSSEIEKLLRLSYRQGEEEYKSSYTNILEDIINEAISLSSSDMHFEVYEEEARIRYRVDGVLIEKRKIKKESYLEIINMIKIQSNLDITEKRLPQDGRTKILDFDIRVSILPTQFGEKVVMRFLGRDASKLDIHSLGFDDDEISKYIETVNKSNGIILISGPTGSGKTTTLYATLRLLNKVERNIMTIEDPVEYILKGVNQTQLNESIGLTFTSALRSFLRQDPDIIMLGEIRDKKTSEMAIRASLTGHLVLSTVHTNSAIGTISRLIDMGIPPFLISETLNLALAQRLVRKLCPNCKKEVSFKKTDFPKSYIIPKEITSYYESEGCEKCHYTGYKGRRAIYEMIVIDSDFSDKIKSGDQNFRELFKQKQIETLSDKAFSLLQKGETSLQEIYSILIDSTN